MGWVNYLYKKGMFLFKMTSIRFASLFIFLGILFASSFKFMKIWSSHYDYINMVKEVWNTIILGCSKGLKHKYI
jgi:hypothetical protein